MVGYLPDLIDDKIDQAVLRIEVQFADDAINRAGQAVMDEMQRAQADAQKEYGFTQLEQADEEQAGVSLQVQVRMPFCGDGWLCGYVLG